MKWFWKMDYCRRNGLPPAQEYAWNIAEHAYKESLMKTYVTFGQCHRHEINDKVFDKDTVAVIHAEDQERGRARAFELFGTKFFTTYTDHNWSKEIESYFPKGLVEVE